MTTTDRPHRYDHATTLSAARRLGLRAPQDARILVEGFRQWLTCLVPALDDHEATFAGTSSATEEDSRQLNFEAREAVARAAELCDAVVEGANTGIARKR